uniref:Uncharacterized protein n=1 Tax=Anguilla anguilla TaxID=7936 RepID=A0A0E9UDU3_ANGAN
MFAGHCDSLRNLWLCLCYLV